MDLIVLGIVLVADLVMNYSAAEEARVRNKQPLPLVTLAPEAVLEYGVSTAGKNSTVQAE